MPVKITEVESNSIAAELGIRPDDEIVSIDARPIRDIIDYRFHSAQDRFVLRLKKAGSSQQVWDLDLELDGEDLGVELEEFRNKGCNNKCIFCFVDQLPPSARPALLFKDDDFRLSFLHGNYVTLTNMRMNEVERVVEQRLSPLYVSVHATDMAVRNRMLGRSDDGGFWEKFNKLIEGGIKLHAQIVLCPTYNDGPVLKQTIFDLFHYYPGVVTVSVVPLGLSKHRESSDGLVAVTREFCHQVIDQVTPYQQDFRGRVGITFAHLADEFYIVTGRPLPPAAHYDGFPLTEDGIGMVRSFAEEFQKNLQAFIETAPPLRRPNGGRRAGALLKSLHGSIVTSTLFEKELRAHMNELNSQTGSRLEVFSVVNDFLGDTISVAGLLAGRDIAAEARKKMNGNFLIVPSEAVANANKLFIDGYRIFDLSSELGVPVFESGLTVNAFFDLISSLSIDRKPKRSRRVDEPERE
jgi:putative radical SAM enzyme (TIGR03279 family)